MKLKHTNTVAIWIFIVIGICSLLLTVLGTCLFESPSVGTSYAVNNGYNKIETDNPYITKIEVDAIWTIISQKDGYCQYQIKTEGLYTCDPSLKMVGYTKLDTVSEKCNIKEHTMNEITPKLKEKIILHQEYIGEIHCADE